MAWSLIHGTRENVRDALKNGWGSLLLHGTIEIDRLNWQSIELNWTSLVCYRNLKDTQLSLNNFICQSRLILVALLHNLLARLIRVRLTRVRLIGLLNDPLPLRYALQQTVFPARAGAHIQNNLKHLVYRKNSTGRQLQVLVDRQFRGRYALLAGQLQRHVLVEVVITQAADYEDVLISLRDHRLFGRQRRLRIGRQKDHLRQLVGRLEVFVPVLADHVHVPVVQVKALGVRVLSNFAVDRGQVELAGLCGRERERERERGRGLECWNTNWQISSNGIHRKFD